MSRVWLLFKTIWKIECGYAQHKYCRQPRELFKFQVGLRRTNLKLEGILYLFQNCYWRANQSFRLPTQPLMLCLNLFYRIEFSLHFKFELMFGYSKCCGGAAYTQRCPWAFYPTWASIKTLVAVSKSPGAQIRSLEAYILISSSRKQYVLVLIFLSASLE